MPNFTKFALNYKIMCQEMGKSGVFLNGSLLSLTCWWVSGLEFFSSCCIAISARHGGSAVGHRDQANLINGLGSRKRVLHRCIRFAIYFKAIPKPNRTDTQLLPMYDVNMEAWQVGQSTALFCCLPESSSISVQFSRPGQNIWARLPSQGLVVPLCHWKMTVG